MDGIQTEDMEGVQGQDRGEADRLPEGHLSRCRDDNVRGTAYYGEVAVEVPFSIENLVAGKNPFEGLKEKVTEPAYEVALADRMYETVERDPDIITGYTAGTPDQVINNGVWTNLDYVTNSHRLGPRTDGYVQHHP